MLKLQHIAAFRALTCVIFCAILTSVAFAQSGSGSGGHCKSKYKETKKYTPGEISTDKIDEAVDSLKEALDEQLSKLPGTNSKWTQDIVDDLTEGTKDKIKEALKGVGDHLGPPNIKSSAYYDRCKDSWGDAYATIKGRSSFTIKVGSIADFAGTVGYDASCSGKITYESVNPSLDPTDGKSTTVTSSVKWTIEITASVGFKPGVNGSISASITDTFDTDHEQELEAD